MKILVVDDTQENIEILNELLGEQYDVLSALDGEFAIETAIEDSPNLILLDIMMPEMDGFEVCKILKANETTKDIPIIFITAKSEEDSIEMAYDMGGIDYITKPFKPKELLGKIKREQKLYQLLESLEKTQEELKLLASTDSMTKLYNRRYFTKISEHILDLTKRKKEKISLIMLDIDKFKNVNDTYGHQVGDDVIIALANKLIKHQRNSDIVCRYGGEEFVILLPNTSLDGAQIVAEKIREDVENFSVKLLSGEDLKFTVSLGIAEANLQNELIIEDALKRADDALYEAKESGRNKVCIADLK